MRGSVVNQVNVIFNEIKAFGESKHADKETARQQGAKTWHQIGKNLNVYSYATADQYRMVWRDAFNYAKERFGLKDIEKLTPEAVQSYLETKIADGKAFSTFQTYAAALEKLETALNRYARSHSTGKEYYFDIKAVRQEAQQTLEHNQPTRAYSDPKSLISSVQNQDYKIIAQAQLAGGFRISELNHISQKNFLPNNEFLVISGKGGKDRTVPLSKETYNNLKSLVETKADKSDGKFKFNMQEYRSALQAAAKLSNQDYTGSHGLRWNFAQETFSRLQEQGKSYEEALQEVSHLLGHERPDITEHYLR